MRGGSSPALTTTCSSASGPHVTYVSTQPTSVARSLFSVLSSSTSRLGQPSMPRSCPISVAPALRHRFERAHAAVVAAFGATGGRDPRAEAAAPSIMRATGTTAPFATRVSRNSWASAARLPRAQVHCWDNREVGSCEISIIRRGAASMTSRQVEYSPPAMLVSPHAASMAGSVDPASASAPCSSLISSFTAPACTAASSGGSSDVPSSRRTALRQAARSAGGRPLQPSRSFTAARTASAAAAGVPKWAI
mmetsp:Transcript_4814/g.13402  ORF Transcript_4814/g.13402 Transcript_4814/m.13402 type:complete len:250 (+) Transcript_4814:285-1034(+)